MNATELLRRQAEFEKQQLPKFRALCTKLDDAMREHGRKCIELVLNYQEADK